MKWLSRVRLFATLWTIAHQALPFMGFSRQEYWSGLPFPSPGDLPNLNSVGGGTSCLVFPLRWCLLSLQGDLPLLPSHPIVFSLPAALPTQRHRLCSFRWMRYHLEGMSEEELEGRRAVSWTVGQLKSTNVDQDGSKLENTKSLLGSVVVFVVDRRVLSFHTLKLTKETCPEALEQGGHLVTKLL